MAKAARARLFPYAAMSLELDGVYLLQDLPPQSWYRPSARERIDFLTGASDLPILCAMMTRENYDLRLASLIIRMGERFQGRHEVAKRYFESLVPCLKHVRGFAAVIVQGVPDCMLVDTTEAGMCRRR